MVKAQKNDRELIVSILTTAFADNKSVNYIISHRSQKEKRIKALMEYSYDLCELFGDIYISEDKTGCALIMKPDLKKTTIRSIYLDAKFILTCIGLANIKKAINRESKVQQEHPKGLLYYLWFIGVEKTAQNKGIGSHLLKDIIKEAKIQNRLICLETSTLKNIPWYEKFGFTIYHEFDFGYKLFSMKRE